MITRENLKDLYPLSPMQEGMLFHSLMDPGSTAYVEQVSYSLAGPLDLALFRRAWQALMDRHDILRTVFIADKGKRPLQAVAKEAAIPFEVTDLGGETAERQRALIDRRVREDLRRGLDLTKGPLVRVAVFRTGAERCEVLWTFHHILLDGWSTGMLVTELGEIYQALCDDRPPRLPQRLAYSHFIRWLEERDKATAIDYWRRRLADYAALAMIPPFKPRPAPGSQATDGPADAQRDAESGPAAGAELVVRLDAAARDAIERAAVSLQATMSTLIQTAWAILLGRYSDRDDVVFGSIVSGRPPSLAGVEEMIGLFINLVPVRVTFAAADTVADVVRRVQREFLESQEHQFVPLSDVQTSPSMVNHLVVYESYPIAAKPLPGAGDGGAQLHVAGVKIREQTHYDLTIVVTPGDGLTITALYNERAYAPDYIADLIDHFRRLLHGVAQYPEERVAELSLLSPGMADRVLAQWNNTAAPYPGDTCIQQEFERQCSRRPAAEAVVCGDRRLSYRELNQRANQLAWTLKSKGIGPDQVVAICLYRSPEMLVALLGILKAGGAYLGLDPAGPARRLTYLLQDARVRVVIAQEELVERLDGEQVEVLCVDRDAAVFDAQPEGDPEPAGTSHDLAYVAYTSGSTGTPNGVSICHFNVMRLVKGSGFADLGPESAVLQYAPLSFDASTLEIWGPLLNGGRVVIVGTRQPTLPELGSLVREHRVSTLWLTAGLFHLMVDEGLDDLGGVRELFAGGDVLSPKHVRQALAALPETEVVNGYGPTESTTFTCCHRMSEPDDVGETVAIGRPIANTQVYILDRTLRPMPVGVPGELYIGGDGLGRGYLNRPDLTAERFLPNPFSGLPGQRLYRSGDLARWLPDGTLDFLGRIDHQVKIRGFRIEPGEIEAALSRLPGVQQSLVLAQRETRDNNGGEPSLRAFLVASGQVEPGQVREALRSLLPDYMIPDSFVILQALPLTPNGKVDRKALMAAAPTDQRREPVGPRSEAEQKLAAIWSEVLGRGGFGVHDNFFDLGGHSLNAMQVLSRLRGQFAVDASLGLLFEAPTIAELAVAVAEAAPIQQSSGSPALKKRARHPRVM